MNHDEMAFCLVLVGFLFLNIAWFHFKKCNEDGKEGDIDGHLESGCLSLILFPLGAILLFIGGLHIFANILQMITAFFDY